jgi:hypothetical protein
VLSQIDECESSFIDVTLLVCKNKKWKKQISVTNDVYKQKDPQTSNNTQKRYKSAPPLIKSKTHRQKTSTGKNTLLTSAATDRIATFKVRLCRLPSSQLVFRHCHRILVPAVVKVAY